MKAALYARVSSEKQAEKDLSIPAQLKALRDFATKKGWEIHAEYVDEAESARSADRPQFQEMISIAKQKSLPFQVILVWKFSRFARNRQDSIIYKTLLRKHGVNVVSINEQIDDSPSGHFMEAILEAVDEFYSMNLAHDTLRGMRENASRGFLNGGQPPYGYKRVRVKVGNNDKSKLDVEPTEAPLVKRIFDLCLKGMGTKEITNNINDAGARTRAGNPWCKTVVHYLLTNETYTGTLIFNRYKKNTGPRAKNGSEKLIRVDNACPAFVTPEIFQKAQDFLKSRSFPVAHPRTTSSEYLLSGLLHCGKCGSRLTGCSAKSGKFFYYACQNMLKKGKAACNSPFLNQNRLESAVVGRLKERVLTEDNIATLFDLVNEELRSAQNEGDGQLPDVEKQLASLNERLNKLYAALETGKFEFDDLAPRVKSLRAEIDAAKETQKRLIAEAEREPIQVERWQIKEYVDDLQDLLTNSSLIESKAFLRSWVKRVEINASSGGIIEYTLPLLSGSKHNANREVLSIVQRSSPSWTIERTFKIEFAWA